MIRARMNATIAAPSMRGAGPSRTSSATSSHFGRGSSGRPSARGGGAAGARLSGRVDVRRGSSSTAGGGAADGARDGLFAAGAEGGFDDGGGFDGSFGGGGAT